jgi:hypothetical protein
LGARKKHEKIPIKQLSEGKAIVLALLVISGGLAIAVFLIRLLIDFFFPGLF